MKRSAPITKSVKSKKSQSKTKPAATGEAPPVVSAALEPACGGDGFDIDAVIAFMKRAIQLQMQAIQDQPSGTEETAAKRSRDARTLDQLVRSMERIEALEKRREKKGRKAKPGADAELKERFVRRLDQLLAAQGKTIASRESEPA